MFRFVASYLINMLENLISEGFFYTAVIFKKIRKAEIKTFIPVMLVTSTFFLKKSVWMDNITATDFSMRTYNILDHLKLTSLGFWAVSKRCPSDSTHILFL